MPTKFDIIINRIDGINDFLGGTTEAMRDIIFPNLRQRFSTAQEHEHRMRRTVAESVVEIPYSLKWID